MTLRDKKERIIILKRERSKLEALHGTRWEKPHRVIVIGMELRDLEQEVENEENNSLR